MDELKTPTRADISDSDKWNLTHLFADVGKWQEDFAWLQQTYPKLQGWKGRVGESAQTLAEVLEFEKSLDLKIERIYHYASLQLAEDSTNNGFLARIGRVQNLLPKIGEAAAFLVPEILAIDAARAAGLPVVLAGKCSEPSEFTVASEATRRLRSSSCTSGSESFAIFFFFPSPANAQ